MNSFTLSKAGVRSGEAVLIVGAPATGKSEYLYYVAAQHLCSGGSVLYMACPGSPSLKVRRFMCILEVEYSLQLLQKHGELPSHAASGNATYDTAVALAGGQEALHEHLLSLSANMTITEFTCFEEMESFWRSPPEKWLSCCAEVAQRVHRVAPLAILDGLHSGGYIPMQERLRGKSLQLSQLLRFALDNWNCALFVAETTFHHSAEARPTATTSDPETVVKCSHTFIHSLGQDSPDASLPLFRYFLCFRAHPSTAANQPNRAQPTQLTNKPATLSCCLIVPDGYVERSRSAKPAMNLQTKVGVPFAVTGEGVKFLA
jgi:hypothetical protein